MVVVRAAESKYDDSTVFSYDSLQLITTISPVRSGKSRSSQATVGHVNIGQLFNGVRDDRRRVLRPLQRTSAQSLNVGISNARSVAGKAASIADWIFSERLSLAAVTETWHDGFDSPSLVVCTPDGYSYVEKARPRQHASSMCTNHGGVCLFYCKQLRVACIDLATYDTVEYVCASVHGMGIKTTVAVLYRPGSTAVSEKFFTEFSDIPERLSHYTSVVIAGDLNIHLDVIDDTGTLKFNTILTDHSYTQHVNAVTHEDGHLLDVLLTRDLSIRRVVVSPPGGLSDHSLIVGSVDVPTLNHYDVVTRHARSWRSFDIDAFLQDVIESPFVQSPPSDVDEQTVRCVQHHAVVTSRPSRADSSSSRIRASFGAVV